MHHTTRHMRRGMAAHCKGAAEWHGWQGSTPHYAEKGVPAWERSTIGRQRLPDGKMISRHPRCEPAPCAPYHDHPVTRNRLPLFTQLRTFWTETGKTAFDPTRKSKASRQIAACRAICCCFGCIQSPEINALWESQMDRKMNPKSQENKAENAIQYKGVLVLTGN